MGVLQLSCIVPAYNEGPRISAVLEVALAVEEIEEVIVVEDGSTDDTAAIVEAMAQDHKRLRLIRQPENRGKTRAVVAGALAARGEYVLLLDSDLKGLRPDDLRRLISPVLSGKAQASISLRGNAPRPWHWIGLDYISGERVLPRALLVQHAEALRDLARFGLEVFMNGLWIEAGYRIAVVQWPHVSSPLKSQKEGLMRGILADLGMVKDILRTIGPFGVLRQILVLRSRRV